MNHLVLIPLVSSLALTACSEMTSPPRAVTPSGHDTFVSKHYGIRVTYPAGFELRRSFRGSYLAADGWKTYLGPDGPPGQPLVALVMPGSNNITDGELRIGVSRDPAALKACTQLPNAARPATRKQVVIDGVPFTTFKAADAAMSHYLVVKSFRSVHRGTCYAFDVLVFGTNPQVYSPPATPPFGRQAVLDRLVPVVLHLQFLDAPVAIAFPATYSGLLPCADCPGIEYQLNLRTNHRYALRMVYRDRDASFEERGAWRLSDDGGTLILEAKDGSPERWAVVEDGARLRKLDAAGQPIRSRLNYELTRRARFTPIGRRSASPTGSG